MASEPSAALQPAPSLNISNPLSEETRDSGIRGLNVIFFNSSHTARQALEDLAKATFMGAPDTNGYSIADYFRDASFLDSSVIPQQTQVEDFYKTNLVARAVNSLWREASIYIVSTSASRETLHDYPVNSSYTSPFTNRTYTLYYYHKKRPRSPPGLDVLSSSLYDISAAQIAESSGRAWEVAGNNYTQQTALQRLISAADANGALTPFQDQAGWEGVTTLPVCDIGARSEWVVDYGVHELPCCCGMKCRDTHRFLQLANLDKSTSWRHRCKRQLKGTDLGFDETNHGVPQGRFSWKRCSKGKLAGAITGMVLAGAFALVLLCFAIGKIFF